MKNTFSHWNKAFDIFPFSPPFFSFFFLSGTHFLHPERDALESLLLLSGRREGFDHSLILTLSTSWALAQGRGWAQQLSPLRKPLWGCILGSPQSWELEGDLTALPCGVGLAFACPSVLWRHSYGNSSITFAWLSPYQAEAAPLLHPCYFELIGDEVGIWLLVLGRDSSHLRKVSENIKNKKKKDQIQSDQAAEEQGWSGLRGNMMPVPQAPQDAPSSLRGRAASVPVREGSAACTKMSSFSWASGNTSVEFQVGRRCMHASGKRLKLSTDLRNCTELPGLDEVTSLDLLQL